MIRVLHAADFHLDSPFEGLSQEKAAQRRAEQRALLMRIAELCAEIGRIVSDLTVVKIVGEIVGDSGSKCSLLLLRQINSGSID